MCFVVFFFLLTLHDSKGRVNIFKKIFRHLHHSNNNFHYIKFMYIVIQSQCSVTSYISKD